MQKEKSKIYKMDKRHDFLGNEVNVGDEVVFVQKEYRNFWIGKISKMTDKTVLITHERANIGGTQTRQFYSQIIKIKD